MKHLLKALLILLAVTLMSSSFGAQNESKYDEFIGKASAETGVDRNLIKAFIKQESHFRDDIGTGELLSSAGAIGAMQLLPGTAVQMGYTAEQMKDPETNIMAGAKYIKFLSGKSYIGNDITRIAAGYFAGPGAVSKYNGVPPWQKTVPYVKSVAGHYANYAGIPPLDLSSVPPAGSGTVPGGGRGTLPINFNPPSISSNSAEVLSKFETYTGISANTLSGILGGILGTLALIFLLLQILLFWKEAYSQGDGKFEALWGSLVHSLRTLLVVSILFIFVT